jgi:hypothetical protein
MSLDFDTAPLAGHAFLSEFAHIAGRDPGPAQQRLSVRID